MVLDSGVFIHQNELHTEKTYIDNYIKDMSTQYNIEPNEIMKIIKNWFNQYPQKWLNIFNLTEYIKSICGKRRYF